MLEQEFDRVTLHTLREMVLKNAIAAGVSQDRAIEVMLAVHELAANAVRHGAGCGRLRMYATARALHCLVSDIGPASRDGHVRNSGSLDGQANGGTQPWPCQEGHGLWLVQQAADHVSMTSGPRGSQVAVVFQLPAASRGVSMSPSSLPY